LCGAANPRRANQLGPDERAPETLARLIWAQNCVRSPRSRLRFGRSRETALLVCIRRQDRVRADSRAGRWKSGFDVLPLCTPKGRPSDSERRNCDSEVVQLQDLKDRFEVFVRTADDFVWVGRTDSMRAARDLIRSRAITSEDQFTIFSETTHEITTVRAAECRSQSH
jgi:hypothetical protein